MLFSFNNSIYTSIYILHFSLVPPPSSETYQWWNSGELNVLNIA